MKQLAPLVLVLALVALGLYLLLGTDLPDGGGLTPVAPATTTAPETTGPSLPEAQATDADEDAAEAVAGERLVMGTGADTRETEATEGGAIVRGRFLLPGGTPAMGVEVELRGYVGNSDREAEFGVPADWADLIRTTDEEGRFELRFDPPRAFQFFVDARLPGFAEEAWRWSELGLAETKDLGTLTLRPAGSIEGYIVNEDGNPTGLRFSVRGQGGPHADFDTGRRPSDARGDLDVATGHFRIDGLPSGTVELSGYHNLAGTLGPELVQVRAGQVTEQDLVYSGPDLSGRIELSVRVRNFHTIRPDAVRIRLVGPNFDSDVDGPGPALDVGSRKRIFDGLEPGLYTAYAEAEGFDPYVREGIEPGSTIGLRLTPSPRLTLALTDAATGEPIEGARLSVELLSQTRSYPREFPLHDGPLPADGVLPPVPAGDLALTVHAEGYADLVLEVLGLGPTEVRPLTGALTPASSILGHVRWTDGRPAVGVTVQAMAAGDAPVLEPEGVGASFPFALPRATTTTGRDGAFVLPGMEPGTYDLHAAATPWLVGGVEGLELGAGQDREQDLTLVGGASLEVRFTGMARPLPRDFQVKLSPAADPGLLTDRALNLDESLFLERGEDGVWRGQDLPTGGARLMLGRAWIVTKLRNSTSRTTGRQEAVAELQLEPDAVTRLEVDLEERAPGALFVQVHRDGEPLAGAKLEVLHEDARIVGESRTDGRATPMYASSSLAGVTHTNAKGQALVVGLFPGEYRISVTEGQAGVFQHPLPVRIDPGGEQRLDMEVGGELADLRIVDQEGQPMADTFVQLSQEGHRTQVRTDDAGAGTVRLLPGTYEVTYNTFDWDTRESTRLVGTLSWPSADEPPLEVVLAPRE